MNETLHTKFGTAKKSNKGYYRVTSRKEGNNGKLLHRLIWEDFYGCEVPKGYVIHHRSHVKTDNCILNLQLMRDSDHKKLHKPWESNKGKEPWNKGKKGCYSKKALQKMSEAQKGENNNNYREDVDNNILSKEYFDNGLSCLKISKKYNISESAVYSRLKNMGQELRDNSGENNPRARYSNLWDIKSIEYDKSNMFRNNRKPNPCKCFYLKYKRYKLPIGGFVDFVTPKIISDLIDEFIEEDDSL